jgi:D-sedoheptulose 7-phosphate isomerase
MNMIKDIEDYILKSSKIIQDSINISEQIESSINLILDCLNRGNKVVFFGNGGSAADAQHIAAEFIGRFKLERNSLSAISLTTDSSILTSIGNDYSFDEIFSRQCEGLIKSGDVSMGISTSGNSKNVEFGLKTSKEKGASTIALLGCDGGSIQKNVDISIIVNSNDTAKIQEVHRVIYHIICDIVESKMALND